MHTDLTARENWVISNPLQFADALPVGRLSKLGFPFYPVDTQRVPRSMAPMGWLETGVVAFDDPGHVWHDPAGKTFPRWARAHTGNTGFAAVARATEQDDGSFVLDLAKAG